MKIYFVKIHNLT